MSLNQIIYKGVGDAIDDTLNLKANTMIIKNGLEVSLINGLPYVGGTVNVGLPFELVQTNSTATGAEWTPDININNINVRNLITLNGSTPSSGSALIFGSSGIPYSGFLPSGSIEPGPANTIMTTNASGNLSKWSSTISVDGDLIFGGNYGTPGQFVKKISGGQTWNNLFSYDITPGTDGQVLTVVNGVSSWATPPSVISPGTAYQILETNSAGTSIDWTSQFKGNSFLLTGNPSNFQSVFSRYYNSYMDLQLYAVPVGGTGLVNQNINVRVYYTIVGNFVNCIINKFTINSIIGVFNQVYLVLFGIPSFLTPVRLDLSDFQNVRQSQNPASFLEGPTLFSIGQPMINVYYRYYGFLESAFEFVLDNPNSFDISGDHGQLFSNANTYSLAGPLSFQYFI